MIRVEIHPEPRTWVQCDRCPAEAPSAPGTDAAAVSVAVGLAISAGYVTRLTDTGACIHLCRACRAPGGQRGLAL